MLDLRLPPEDRTLSPRTGWTRAHWEATADHLLAALEPWATEGYAQYRLPGRPSHSGVASDGLEGFARTFLIAAFRAAGSHGEAAGARLDRYAQGLIAGTDPAHPYAWPRPDDMSQSLVEAASIAVALHETRPWLFDRLAPAEQARVVDWLAAVAGKRTPDNNWVLFRVMVLQFLATVGGPHDTGEIDAGLDRIEPWYVGDGWYTDGDGQNFDYYCGWALHLYPVLWARMSGDTTRRKRYAWRLSEFLAGYQHFFAGDGSPVFQGRSLTYRYATVAPLWLGALADATPLAPGVTRRLASGALRHFTEHGVPDGRGLLTLGWHGSFPPMAQAYSGPASPYWAAKAFLGLLLPADHPVWTDREEPAPIDSADTCVTLPGPGWLLHGTRADGVVRLVNHGSDRAARTAAPDPHYVRLAYSTHTGPQLDLTSLADPIDGHLAVLAPDGVASARREVERLGVADRFAVSAYDDGPVRVVTASVVGGGAEVRVHAVTAPAGYLVRDGGYAIAAGERPTAWIASPAVRLQRPDGLSSGIASLTGFTAAGVHRTEGADAFGRCAAVPFLTAGDHPGGTRLYVSLVTLGRADPAAVRLISAEDLTVTLRWSDGDTVTVRLGARPRFERRAPGGAIVARWPRETPVVSG
jgi:hypothetical protein